MRGAFAAVIVLACLGSQAGAVGPPPSDRQVLDSLLAEHRRHSLPLPPKGARLVRYFYVGGAIVNGEQQPDVYALGFLARTTKGQEQLLGGLGWQWLTAAYPRRGPVPTDARALKTTPDGPHETLVFAVQCHSLGWTDLAVAALKRVRAKGERVSLGEVRSRAWDYWQWKISSEGSDWKEIARRLKAISHTDRAFRSVYHQATIDDLELALVPRKVKPDSVEALIERLVIETGATGTMSRTQRAKVRDRIVGLGFKAVPALIDRLDDRRMTRHVMRGFNNFRSWNMRLQHVVSDLLEEIAGKHIGRDWLRRQQAYAVKKADALAWWKDAKKLGEEGYALANVLPPEGAAPNGYLLALISAKYPKHLPALYRQVLRDRPKMTSDDLVVALMGSSLSRREKRTLLCEGALRPNLTHRLEALHALLRVDRPLSLRIIRQSLLELPREVKRDVWWCEEARYAHLVSVANDPGLWGLLERVAKRSDIALRMELLNYAGREWKDAPPSWRRSYLALLASFLDDAESRDRRKDEVRYSGPVAGFQYDVLSVRDFVAMEMAAQLDIGVPLKLDRSAKEWAALRQQVRDTWVRERDKKPSPRK